MCFFHLRHSDPSLEVAALGVGVHSRIPLGLVTQIYVRCVQVDPPVILWHRHRHLQVGNEVEEDNPNVSCQ